MLFLRMELLIFLKHTLYDFNYQKHIYSQNIVFNFRAQRMQDSIQKQKFVTTMVRNMEYLNKDLLLKHILEFLKANPQFSPRETIRNLSGGTFICLVQITGYVQIQRAYHEMYIGFKLDYPRSPPIFLILIDRNNFIVTDEQRLLQFHYIALERNERNQDFVRLRYPIIQKQWNPNSLTLNGAFMNLMQIINRPPLFQPKFDAPQIPSSQKNIRQTQQQNTNKIKILNSKQINNIVGTLYNDVTEVLIGKQNLQQESQAFDYSQSRQTFLRGHLNNLKNQLSNTKMLVQSQNQRIGNQLAEINRSGNCDKLFECSQADKNKLNIITEMQVLKEAQVKLRTKLEKQNGAKFSDYKKIMKILYDKMFENQTNLLLSQK